MVQCVALFFVVPPAPATADDSFPFCTRTFNLPQILSYHHGQLI